MLSTIFMVALIILSLSILGCLYRVLKGPSIADRIVALDTIGIHLLAIITILCMVLETRVYFGIILLIGALTFVGTTAYARYIERGVVMEHGDDHPVDR
jgi:multicomponent Na+:H+ antiporter subunit F